MTKSEPRSTYVRKTSDGEYEFGFSYPNRNFRKQSTNEPLGVRSTLATALIEQELLIKQIMKAA